MSPKTIWLLAVLVVCSYPATASTYYVGTCKTGSFATIGAAVKTVPAGSTILICAGQYSEQVIISKDLTLTGLSSSPNGATGAVIANAPTPQTTTSPIFAFNENPILGGTIAPVIWVTAGTVTIQNVFVTSTTAEYCPNPTITKTVGFYYATGASGTLNHVGFFGQSCGVGIWAENASFTPTAVTVENSYSAAGIVAGSLPNLVDGTLTVTIKGNQVFPTSPDGSYGIYLYGVSGTVETNFISGPRSYDGNALSGTAIWDDGNAQTDVTISGNTIQVVVDTLVDPILYTGILSNVDGATIKGNKISGPQYGIYVTCHAGTVSGNTISYAGLGIIGVPAAYLGVNTFYNTGTKILGGC
jgi:hypothetical protein